MSILFTNTASQQFRKTSTILVTFHLHCSNNFKMYSSRRFLDETLFWLLQKNSNFSWRYFWYLLKIETVQPIFVFDKALRREHFMQIFKSSLKNEISSQMPNGGKSTFFFFLLTLKGFYFLASFFLLYYIIENKYCFSCFVLFWFGLFFVLFFFSFCSCFLFSFCFRGCCCCFRGCLGFSEIFLFECLFVCLILWACVLYFYEFFSFLILRKNENLIKGNAALQTPKMMIKVRKRVNLWNYFILERQKKTIKVTESIKWDMSC